MKHTHDDLDLEIADLERRLAEAKARRQQVQQQQQQSTHPHHHQLQLSRPTPQPTPTATHFLLLLSDSALPLGSFAFSSGLESYLTHQKLPSTRLFHPSSSSTSSASYSSFSTFFPLSLSSMASTSLPFVLAAHRLLAYSTIGNPDDDIPSVTTRLAALDDAADAALPCTVARRASVAQGRALLGIWERAFAPAAAAAVGEGEKNGSGGGAKLQGVAMGALKGFSSLLRSSGSSSSQATTTAATTVVEDEPPPVSAHLAPLFGAVCAVLGLSEEQAAYTFLLGHAKAVVSAAVRAGVFGPYQAQRTLAGAGVHELIGAVMEREWHTPVEEAGQTVPVLDLWVGRHEVLYSRIFNS
ncbi:hypothetical protein VTJ04DRAFT_2785 [Mycothermus thermophilus]|uniref:uncharacterized protein n=1 Tax=Humicola insolens TaxID=85995 RepID=UPI0037445373